MLSLATIHKLTKINSDHNPLILDTIEDEEVKHISFKFQLMWLLREDFLEIVGKYGMSLLLPEIV